MLKDSQKTVRLTTDSDSKSKMLHTIGDITSCQQLLSKLNLMMKL